MSRRILLLFLITFFILSGYSESWESHPYKCFDCGKTLLILKDGRWSPTSDRERVTFELSNKSIMNIQICSECKEELTKEDYKDIMQSIKDGWEYEITVLNNWNEDQQQNYRDRFYNLEIIKRIK